MKYKALVIGLMAVGLAACSSKVKPTDPAKLLEISQQTQMDVQWTADIGPTKTLGFTPTLVGDKVYAANEKGRIVELDLQTGRVLNSIDTKDKLVAGVAVAGDLVFVGSASGDLVAYNMSTKAEAWRTNLTSVLSEAPLMLQSVLVVKTKDGRLTGFNPMTGDIGWSFVGAQSGLQVRGTGSMTPMDERHFLVGQDSGVLQLVDAGAGAPVFEAPISFPRGATDFDRVTEVLSRPIMDGPQICAAAFQGYVTCYDMRNWQVMWSKPLSSSKGIEVYGDLVVVSEDNGVVSAFNRADGESVWQNDSLKNRRISAPILLKNGLVVVDFEGYAHIMDPLSGAFIGRTKLPVGALTAQPLRLNGMTLLQGASGKLMLVGAGVS
ncbi:outer membrane protein assembly factor BamB [Neisseriaceae bacterium CLB008]|nr:outer membrane protein assembly factor BamB [Neisseriaceae bacterium]